MLSHLANWEGVGFVCRNILHFFKCHWSIELPIIVSICPACTLEAGRAFQERRRNKVEVYLVFFSPRICSCAWNFVIKMDIWEDSSFCCNGVSLLPTSWIETVAVASCMLDTLALGTLIPNKSWSWCSEQKQPLWVAYCQPSQCQFFLWHVLINVVFSFLNVCNENLLVI